MLDPTCGEAVFLEAAAARLRALGADDAAAVEQLSGVDLHRPSLDASVEVLGPHGARANLVCADFFEVPTPAQIGDRIGWQDAVIGNPPFIRYQRHRGMARKRSVTAALAQGVRLSGLASSWAATLVHASAFLKPDGRLAMVLPAELLTVGYAEPIRRWLRQRFAVVNLVLFERLQFRGASEQVVLLVAHGTGPSAPFCLHHVRDSDDLADLHPLDSVGASPADEGKWSELVLPLETRQLLAEVGRRMAPLEAYGTPELGTVTGANDYFALSEETRRAHGLREAHLKRISPPGTRHLRGLEFSARDWDALRRAGERVWLLHPKPNARGRGLAAYLERGVELGVPRAYKCSVRDPWWRPPAVPVPDLFFTYMSHLFPRLITNAARVTFLNSMHGIRLRAGVPPESAQALPLLVLNSATMLGAEVTGRSYGGGILKMEPREAARLPVLAPDDLVGAWRVLADRREQLGQSLERGDWWSVTAEVDRVVLRDVLGFTADEAAVIRDAATLLRVRRTRKVGSDGDAAKARRTR